jgi:GNAT superfamily N-acetyltransferase
MSEPLEVRAVTPDDDPRRLRALRLEMLADTPIAFIERVENARRHPPGYWADRLKSYAAGADRTMYLAETPEGSWVATAGAYVDAKGVAHLVSVYVTPSLRGTGLFDALAQAVFDWARARGCTEIRLEVALANARALAAYRRLGFAPTGYSQPHPLYPDESIEIEMACPLPAACGQPPGRQAQSGPYRR